MEPKELTDQDRAAISGRCERCRGRGVVTVVHGVGDESDDVCHDCRGTGSYETRVTVLTDAAKAALERRHDKTVGALEAVIASLRAQLEAYEASKPPHICQHCGALVAFALLPEHLAICIPAAKRLQIMTVMAPLIYANAVGQVDVAHKRDAESVAGVARVYADAILKAAR